MIILIDKIKAKILNEIERLGQNLFYGSNYSQCIILRDLYFWIKEQEGENISL